MNDTKKLDHAVACATRVADEYYPQATAVFLAGSFVRHEATECSDLDLVVLFDSLDSAYRESYLFEDYPVEAFVHDLQTLRYFFFEFEREDAVPSLANMVDEGIVIFSTSAHAQIAKEMASNMLKQGPATWSNEDIQKSRYAITDALDDLRASRSQPERLGTATVLYSSIANHFLRRQGHWSARGKSINRELRRIAPEFAIAFENAFEQLLVNADSEKLVQLVETMLEPDGGLLFEGYRVNAPKNWRIVE